MIPVTDSPVRYSGGLPLVLSSLTGHLAQESKNSGTILIDTFTAFKGKIAYFKNDDSRVCSDGHAGTVIFLQKDCNAESPSVESTTNDGCAYNLNVKGICLCGLTESDGNNRVGPIPMISPTTSPTLSPTLQPTLAPTLSPTLQPTLDPTLAPTSPGRPSIGSNLPGEKSPPTSSLASPGHQIVPVNNPDPLPPNGGYKDTTHQMLA